MSEERIMCSVYRSPKQDGMYIYVPKHQLFEKVPKELMQRFGPPGHVMDLLLTQGRSLARVNVKEVMASLSHQGYFLQMPPHGGAGF